MKIDPPQKYSSGTRLKIIETTAESKNHTVEECFEQNQTQWQMIIIIIISTLLNGLLIIMIIGLLKVFVFGSKRTRDNLKQSQDTNLQQPHAMDLEQQQAPTQVQYATVDFPMSCQRFNPSQVNSTYELLQFPKSWTPKHNHIQFDFSLHLIKCFVYLYLFCQNIWLNQMSLPQWLCKLIQQISNQNLIYMTYRAITLPEPLL